MIYLHIRIIKDTEGGTNFRTINLITITILSQTKNLLTILIRQFVLRKDGLVFYQNIADVIFVSFYYKIIVTMILQNFGNYTSTYIIFNVINYIELVLIFDVNKVNFHRTSGIIKTNRFYIRTIFYFAICSL